MHDSAQVSKLISRIRCLKNYAYLWQTADSFASEPLTQAITVVSQCLDILDDIKKVSQCNVFMIPSTLDILVADCDHFTGCSKCTSI
jgi:hypothetical protein